MTDRIYRPLMATMADDVTQRGAEAARHVAPLDWHLACALAARVGADALAALIEDAAWYGEETVSLGRLKRLRELLNDRSAALRGDQPEAGS